MPQVLPLSAFVNPAGILGYHETSKHRPERYAPGPRGLDWATQPDPFLEFQGAGRLHLPLAADGEDVSFEALRAGRAGPPRPFAARSLGVLLELSAGLSAWKEHGGSRWALRCTPSSGNLHPTETWLATPSLPGIEAGVYHYASRDHALEHLCAPPAAWDSAWTCPGVLAGLSSIAWREIWKYGVRGFRYCQHDCGHAIAALAYAAAVLGWNVAPLRTVSSDDLSDLLGLGRTGAFHENEDDEPEVLLWIGAPGGAPDAERLASLAREGKWTGQARPLSQGHRLWPDAQAAARSTRDPGSRSPCACDPKDREALRPAGSAVTAARLIRRRRSAVAFDGVTTMSGAAFHTLLDATLPRSGHPPWTAWDARPLLHLALFVHRVSGIEPGLYLLVRDESRKEALRAAMRPEWWWRKTGPETLPLYLLLPHDLREHARFVSCHQEIASDSCFALGMIAPMDDIEPAPWRYRDRFREAGLIGQALYLEAEAAGLRGTGIGCFFDDEMHGLLGLEGKAWQSLYHFTVGAPVEDTRLTTLPPYPGRGT